MIDQNPTGPRRQTVKQKSSKVRCKDQGSKETDKDKAEKVKEWKKGEKKRMRALERGRIHEPFFVAFHTETGRRQPVNRQ